MMRIGHILLLLFLVMQLNAQQYDEVKISVKEILQYQCVKAKFGEVNAPFRKFGFKRIGAHKVLGDDFYNVNLWGYHVSANLEYDKDRQPLYRLFRRNDMGSMAVIDRVKGDTSSCRLIFWGKKYYRRIADELRRLGFVMQKSATHSNCLEFRKKDISVCVDVIIWGDIYLVDFI